LKPDVISGCNVEIETFYLICFESTQKAFYTEKQFKQTCSVRLVPIPPEIRAGCGLGLRIAPEDFDTVKSSVIEDDIYIVQKEGNKRHVQKWNGA
jgi:hypothetical protein